MDDPAEFSYAAWQDAMDVAANPVENKIRRDWLSHLLVEQLDRYAPSQNIDELEFLQFYADDIFVKCLALVEHNPVANTVGDRLQVKPDAGWHVREQEFASLFNDSGSAFAQRFKFWLADQGRSGSELKEQLLEVYCNQGERALKDFPIGSLAQQPATATEPWQKPKTRSRP